MTEKHVVYNHDRDNIPTRQTLELILPNGATVHVSAPSVQFHIEPVTVTYRKEPRTSIPHDYGLLVDDDEFELERAVVENHVTITVNLDDASVGQLLADLLVNRKV